MLLSFVQVRWVRALYSDFETFRRDQEYLISQEQGKSFDYIEGFVVSNSESLLDNWRSSLFLPHKSIRTRGIISANASEEEIADGATRYYLEVTKNYDEAESEFIDDVSCIILSS